MNAKEIVERVLDNLLAKAINEGAQPLPVLHELAEIEGKMKGSYREGDIGCAVGYATLIGKRAQEERDAIDKKCAEKFKRGEFSANFMADPEYITDFVNMRVLDKWLRGYGPHGENMKILREFEQGVRSEKLSYLGTETD